MLMWIIIGSLIFIGLLLIIVELVFIPGTTVVGLLGLIFSIVGVAIGYNHFGNQAGFYLVLGTASVTLVALFYSFRSGSWSRFSLKSSIDGKVNEDLLNLVHIGDVGITRSSLRPMGTAEFNNRNFEVKSNGDYLDSGQRVRIVHVQQHQIIVELIK